MPAATQLPERFGRYRILRKLGEGGMGAVYLAEDSQLHRRVALKVPHFSSQDGPEVIERFYREARVAAGIEHPNICAVHDVGQIDGIHFLTMPFIEGTPLSQRLNPDQPWPPAKGAALVIRLAVALHAMHHRGLMHRDLKPANIMLRAGDEPVIMDFGLARSVSQSDRMTVTGAVVGTPAYMSPEQVLADPKTIGAATDIYSLGVICYQLLTGELPFPGPGPAIFGQILHAEAQPPSLRRPGLDPQLDAICKKAMAKQPGDRYATMADFAADLKTYLHAQKGGSSGKPRSSKRPRRSEAPATVPPSPAAVAAATTPTPPPTGSDTGWNDRRMQRRPYRQASLAGAVAGIIVLLLLIWLPFGGLTRNEKASQKNDAPRDEVVPEKKDARRDEQKERKAAQAPEEDTRKKSASTVPPKAESPAVVPPVSPKPFPEEFTNTVGMQLRRIAGGTFQMGSEKSRDSDAVDDEQPRHSVNIGPQFFMAAHKTTQGQFAEVLGRKPSWFWAGGGAKEKVAGLDTTRLPIEKVTWFDAIEFCNKLSEREDRRPCYRLSAIRRNDDGSIEAAEVEVLKDGRGYRLPSEAEWEFCARAGTTTKYAFGEDAGQLGEYAWFEANSGGRTHPVGEKKPNPWGLYDMGGLAWEWCEDVWHANYAGAPGDGSAWQAGGQQNRRVVRGGQWNSRAGYCRCAGRSRAGPGLRFNYLGFRVVLVSP